MATVLTPRSAFIVLIMAAGASTPDPIMMLPRKRKISAARVLIGFAAEFAMVGDDMACVLAVSHHGRLGSGVAFVSGLGASERHC